MLFVPCIVSSTLRHQDMAGPKANCPQNLLRAHKMLRPRTNMALENVDLFQHMMQFVQRIYKIPGGGGQHSNNSLVYIRDQRKVKKELFLEAKRD